jgi:hypothetical protein
MENLQFLGMAAVLLAVAGGMAFYEWTRIRAFRPILNGHNAVVLYWVSYLSLFVLGVAAALAAVSLTNRASGASNDTSSFRNRGPDSWNRPLSRYVAEERASSSSGDRASLQSVIPHSIVPTCPDLFGLCVAMAYFEPPQRNAKMLGEMIGWLIIAGFFVTVFVASYR